MEMKVFRSMPRRGDDNNVIIFWNLSGERETNGYRCDTFSRLGIESTTLVIGVRNAKGNHNDETSFVITEAIN